MTPLKPYLIRSINEWILDNNLTPYILVDAGTDHVVLPESFIRDGQIVLNISPEAVRGLVLTDESIEFNARFGGSPMDIYVPTRAVLAIYAKENGKGMVFDKEHDGEPSPPTSEKSQKPQLRIVK